MGGTHIWYWHCGEEKYLALLGIKLGCPVHSSLLYWLRYPDSKERRSTQFTYKEKIFQISMHVFEYSDYNEGQVLWCLCLQIMLLIRKYRHIITEPQAYDHKSWQYHVHVCWNDMLVLEHHSTLCTFEKVDQINTISQKVPLMLVISYHLENPFHYTYGHVYKEIHVRLLPHKLVSKRENYSKINVTLWKLQTTRTC